MSAEPGDLVDLPARFGMDRPVFDRLTGRPPGALRPAASVLLLRDGPAGEPEVFLLERVSEMEFAPGMTVFPGGGVDASDGTALADGVVDERAARAAADAWRVDADTAAALLCAAVRETFEETGVLLADLDAPVPPGARDRLAARDLALADVLAGTSPRWGDLHPWARWVTPEAMPRRYDTWFFVAAVPDGQEPDGATSEAAHAAWCAPARALREWEEGRRGLLPPTWAVLGDLAARPGPVAAVLAAAAARHLDPVTPQFRPDDERVGLAVPSHALGVAR